MTPDDAASPGSASAPTGGPFADISDNPRIPILMRHLSALSDAQDPLTVLDDFIAAIRNLDGPRTYIALHTQDLPPGQYRIARWLTADGRDLVRPASPWRGADLAPVPDAGGFLAQVTATPSPKLAPNLQLDDDPILGPEAASLRSMIAVPFVQGGRPIAWTLLFRAEPDSFTPRDLEASMLRTTLVGATAASALASRRLRAAHDWIQSEIDQIAQIQRSLLPQEEPDVPGLSFTASYATFDRAGGDYYDLLPLRHLPDELPLARYTEDLTSPWVILIADASGHGPSAAVVVAMLHAILHGYHPPQEGQPSPAEMLEQISRRLFARRIGAGASFVTAFLGLYDPVARTLTYANAGHHPPLLRTPRQDGGVPTVTALDSPRGTPMGVRDHVGAEDRTITLTRGQTILLFTDGVVEATGEGRGDFGIEALRDAFAHGPNEPRALIAHLEAALRAHESAARPHDDQTLVALQAV